MNMIFLDEKMFFACLPYTDIRGSVVWQGLAILST